MSSEAKSSSPVEVSGCGPWSAEGPSRTIERSVDIAAPPQAVWRVLTDLDQAKLWGGCFGAGCEMHLPEGGGIATGKPVEWMVLDEIGQKHPCTKGTWGAVDEPKLLRADFPAQAMSPLAMSEQYALEARQVDGRDGTRLSISCGPLPLSAAECVEPGWPRALKVIKLLAEGVTPSHEDLTPPEMVMVVDSAPRRTAAIEIILEKGMEGIAPAMGTAIPELFAELEKQGIKPVGRMLSHYMQEPAQWDPRKDGKFQLRVCIPIAPDTKLSPSGRLVESQLPGCKVARLWYTGPYSGLPEAWGRLDAFVREKGLKKQHKGWFFESYLRGPEQDGKEPLQDSERCITQLSWPLEVDADEAQKQEDTRA